MSTWESDLDEFTSLCPLDTFHGKLHEVNELCCPGDGSCDGEMPEGCPYACGRSWTPFYESCGPLLTRLYPDADVLGQFTSRCLDVDPVMMAQALHDSVCTVCGDGVVGGNEQCDEGALNSDESPNAACRINCERPPCESDSCGGCRTERECQQNIPPSSSLWTLAVGGETDVGEAEFNRMFHEAPHGIIKFVCGSACTDPDRHEVYYKRLSASDDFNAYTNMVDTWASSNNLIGEDFNIFSSYEDALANANAWTTCNYDIRGIGFPVDCGPNGLVRGCQLYSRGRGQYCHGGNEGSSFFIEAPVAGCQWTDGVCTTTR
eukprot:SAG31_NODE_6497_length_1995_cov_1.741034_2_plen_319_part_00